MYFLPQSNFKINFYGCLFWVWGWEGPPPPSYTNAPTICTQQMLLVATSVESGHSPLHCRRCRCRLCCNPDVRRPPANGWRWWWCVRATWIRVSTWLLVRRQKTRTAHSDRPDAAGTELELELMSVTTVSKVGGAPVVWWGERGGSGTCACPRARGELAAAAPAKRRKTWSRREQN